MSKSKAKAKSATPQVEALSAALLGRAGPCEHPGRHRKPGARKGQFICHRCGRSLNADGNPFRVKEKLTRYFLPQQAPGTVVEDGRGRKYRVAPDGSLRRMRPAVQP